MSGAAALPRAAAGARPGKTWPDSVRSEAISLLKGDNNAPWAILAEVVLGCVPIVGQVIDARDVIKGLAEVAKAPQSGMAWFNLVTAVVGIVPGGGDLVKRGARSIKSGAMQADELLSIIRRFYKGDPEALIKQVLDPGKIIAKLDEILTNPKLLKHVDADVRKQIDHIRAEIGKHATALRKDVDEWLAKGRKTSADTGPAAKKVQGSPPAKPETKVKEGSKTKGEHQGAASPTTPNPSTLRTQAFKLLTNGVLGVLGEHMADYHCQDIKGWYATVKAPHDRGQINIAKANDGGHLVQLWPIQVRGRGIDAVWHTEKARKPYAIVEAKASADPTCSLNSLLGDAKDKNESSNGTSAGDSNAGKTSRGGRRGAQTRTNPDERDKNERVTQMSHKWIERRIKAAVRGEAAVLRTFKERGIHAYSRHVLFFSIPEAAAHAEALILHAAGSPVDQAIHGAHPVTREWGDGDIQAVVDQRAQKSDAKNGASNGHGKLGRK